MRVQPFERTTLPQLQRFVNLQWGGSSYLPLVERDWDLGLAQPRSGANQVIVRLGLC
jgi:hypothetical protein